jgi:2-(1,2-epoxy-1,2-dihydrophenyl)acetyl-CoA isomerase
MTDEEGSILFAREGDVAIITLHAPDQLNAFSYAMLEALPRALDQAADTGARVAVITGSGRGFCSGAALGGSQMEGHDLGDLIDRYYNPIAVALAESPIPIVTAVNGVAAGAGASLALAGDIIVAARSAYFMLAFSRIGLVPDMGATWLVARSVGRVKALEMALLGEKLSAEDALAAGLVTRVVEDEALHGEVMSVAGRLAALPRTALATIRRQVRTALDSSFETMLTVERDNQRKAGRTQDHAEGLAAFREKRAPVFTGA